MLNYGPSENQKFAIPIKPENFDLITFMNFGTPPSWMVDGAYLDGNHYYTYTISKASQQSVANRKVEDSEKIKAPWNKLNPVDRKIVFVSV